MPGLVVIDLPIVLCLGDDSTDGPQSRPLRKAAHVAGLSCTQLDATKAKDLTVGALTVSISSYLALQNNVLLVGTRKVNSFHSPIVFQRTPPGTLLASFA